MSIWKLLTTVNPQLDIEAVILDMLLGGLLFMSVTAFIHAFSKKGFIRRPTLIIMTMIGMILGAYWPVFRHNAMMELAGETGLAEELRLFQKDCMTLFRAGDCRPNEVVDMARLDRIVTTYEGLIQKKID